MNINSAKTRSRACKPGGVVSIDSPRAVKRAFSVELSWRKQVSSTLLFVHTKWSNKTHSKGTEWKPWPGIHTLNFVTLDNICWKYSLFTQALSTTIPKPYGCVIALCNISTLSFPPKKLLCRYGRQGTVGDGHCLMSPILSILCWSTEEEIEAIFVLLYRAR